LQRRGARNLNIFNIRLGSVRPAQYPAHTINQRFSVRFIPFKTVIFYEISQLNQLPFVRIARAVKDLGRPPHSGQWSLASGQKNPPRTIFEVTSGMNL
jgi:hypothetical protein